MPNACRTDSSVNFSSASARALPSGCPSCKRIRPEPLWGETLSLGQSVTLLRQNHSSKAGKWCTHRPSTGNYVTATHQEEVCDHSPRAGNWMPPEKQPCFHSLLGRGGAQPANFFPQRSKGVAYLVKTRLGRNSGNLPKVARIMGAIFGNYLPKARPFRPPLGGAPIVGIDEGREGNRPRALRPVAQVGNAHILGIYPTGIQVQQGGQRGQKVGVNTETIGSVCLEPLTGLTTMLLHVVQEPMQARTWLTFRA